MSVSITLSPADDLVQLVNAPLTAKELSKDLRNKDEAEVLALANGNEVWLGRFLQQSIGKYRSNYHERQAQPSPASIAQHLTKAPSHWINDLRAAMQAGQGAAALSTRDERQYLDRSWTHVAAAIGLAAMTDERWQQFDHDIVTWCSYP